jgi:hypothetical protein
MSHTVRIVTQVRDAVAVAAAATRLELPAPETGTFALYASEATGLAVRLPGWRYPLVCQLASGELAFDTFEGAWGERAQLDRFLQAYAIEKTRLEARRSGYAVTEAPLADGSVKLTIHLGESP